MSVTFTISHLAALVSIIAAVLTFAWRRNEASNEKLKAMQEQIHQTNLTIRDHRLENARRYVTKKELRSVLQEFKEFFRDRFDRIEAVIQKEEEK